MSQPQLAVQLYSVRDNFNEDPKATIQAVADMGYAGVEFFGQPQHKAEDLKSYLDDAGIVCCGWHTPFANVQEDTLAECIAFNKALDNQYVIIPGLPPECKETLADWEKTAAFFNDLSDKLGAEGMRTGYHNHHTEFIEMDGKIPWDVFFENTKDEVIMQLDMGNALSGDADLVGTLKKFHGRAETAHIKPFKQGLEGRSAGYKPLIGEDSVPWPEVFEQCESGGCKWYIVEYESDQYPRLEAVERCLNILKDMGK